MIDKTLAGLGLRDEEIKTFLFLLENGPTTAGNLAKKSGLSRPSLYGFVRKLQNIGLVIESQKNGVKTFSASSKDKVSALFEEKISDLEKGKTEIEKTFSEIAKLGASINPKFQLFEGKEGLRQILKDILLYRDLKTKAYWPIKSMMEVLGKEFFRDHNRERVKRNIYIQGIWPEKQKVNIETNPYMGTGGKFLRELRIAPKEIDFSMGYWIYGNKVVFLSSRKEAYGFIIESKDLVEMMSSQFDIVWNLSKKLPISKKAEEEFFKEN